MVSQPSRESTTVENNCWMVQWRCIYNKKGKINFDSESAPWIDNNHLNAHLTRRAYNMSRKSNQLRTVR